jgi:hypothetical protein
MRSVAAIAVVLLAAAAQAQVSEVIEVRVANVDVVVLDRAGKPITGLTKDDFQLFEDGKPQPLTNFYETRGEAPAGAPEPQRPPEVKKRSILLFFDSSSIAFFARNKVPVTITFPSDITYLPEGEKMVGEYAVVFVTATSDGAMSQITRQVHKVSFPSARASEIGAQQLLQTTATLLVKKGTQSVSVAIVDRRGARSGYGKATFTAE